MKPFRCLRPIDGWCRICCDRPARKGGLCLACWIDWCNDAADLCVEAGDIDWANGLRWEASEAKTLLGVSHVLEPRRDA